MRNRLLRISREGDNETPEGAGSGGPQGLPAWGPAHDRHSLDRARRSAPTKLREDCRSVSTITRTSYYLRRWSGSPATDLRFHRCPELPHERPDGRGGSEFRGGDVTDPAGGPLGSEVGDLRAGRGR